MDALKIIQHPLDRFSFSGNLGDLDRTGRVAVDQLMTMIADMRFRKDSIWGTCARYFLLIDLSWFPRLCFSAQLNSEKLRAYLWLCERGELEDIFDDGQTVMPFIRRPRTKAALTPAFETQFEFSYAHDTRVDKKTDGLKEPPRRFSPASGSSLATASPQSVASGKASGARRK